MQITLADGQLVFTIKGAKTHNGKFGQEIRNLTVRVESKEAEYLVNKICTEGSPILVTAKAGALSDCIRDFSKIVFPKLRDSISAYVFRHQISANLKASDMSSTDISAALGHNSDETKRYYGDVHAACGKVSISKIQATGIVKEHTPERIRKLEKSRENSRDRER